MKAMKIKVCGMREPKNIQDVAALGVDMIGFIFYPKSPRYVRNIPSDAGIIPDRSSLNSLIPTGLTPEPTSLTPSPLSKREGSDMLDKQLKAEEIGEETRNRPSGHVQSQSPFNKVTTPLAFGEGHGGEAGEHDMLDKHKRCERVGVFVDDMPQNIVTAVYNYHLDYVQLHGSESPVMIDNLRRTLVPDIVPQIKVIKAISVATADDLKQCGQYEGHVDLFLFDTKCKTYGGSGQQYDWSVLDAYQGDTPFLLSGGIGPDDIDRLRSFHHPKCIGIDLNSRFETAPGLKDVEKLRKFLSGLTPNPSPRGEGSD